MAAADVARRLSYFGPQQAMGGVVIKNAASNGVVILVNEGRNRLLVDADAVWRLVLEDCVIGDAF